MRKILTAAVVASLLCGGLGAEESARLPLVEFHNGLLVSCRNIEKVKSQGAKGELSGILRVFGVKPQAEMIDLASAQIRPIDIKSAKFQKKSKEEGCSAPDHISFQWVPLGAPSKEVTDGFLKPDWLTPVENLAKEYPAAWSRWQKNLPELIKQIDADGGFRLDPSPEFRKADEERINHPALIFKDKRTKAADGGFVFIIASHYFPKQIYLNAAGEFQEINFNDCVPDCDD